MGDKIQVFTSPGEKGSRGRIMRPVSRIGKNLSKGGGPRKKVRRFAINAGT